MTTLIEKDAIDEQADLAGYREISGLAVVGAIAGALSILALDSVAFFFIPLIAAVINWRALAAIRENSLAGRGAALAGLALALIFAISGAVMPYGRELANRHQAVETARHWFEALRNNEPEIAHQWTMPRWIRVHEGDSIRTEYASKSGPEVLKRYLQQPAVHAVLKLGRASHVRYYGNVSSELTDDELRTIVDVYAVTVKNAQEATTFFVKVKVLARLDKLRKAWSWELNGSELLTEPPSLGHQAIEPRGAAPWQYAQR